MSKIVARTQKIKAGNLIGIGNHNQRKFENHSNEAIDPEKKNMNYDLVPGRTENFKTDIEKYINENKSSNRAVRKDAVLVNEWLISSDQEFFKKLSADETKEFFETSKDYFAEKFGDQNIRYAIVHLDETTPHMHMGIVPFDEDNKLSAKRMFNKTALKEIQAELPEYLKNKGFDIERGEKDSERKNLSIPEFKKMMQEQEDLKLKTEKLRETKNDLENKINEMTFVKNELSHELVEQVERLEQVEFTAKDYGYEDIEEILYENHKLKTTLNAVYEKLNQYADILSNLKLNILNFDKISSLVKELIPALRGFKDRLEVKGISSTRFREELQAKATLNRQIKPKRTLAERMEHAKHQLRSERKKDVQKRNLDDLER